MRQRVKISRLGRDVPKLIIKRMRRGMKNTINPQCQLLADRHWLTQRAAKKPAIDHVTWKRNATAESPATDHAREASRHPAQNRLGKARHYNALKAKRWRRKKRRRKEEEEDEEKNELDSQI